MAKFAELKIDNTLKICFSEDPENKTIFRTYFKKAEHINTTFSICPFCEDEKIHSRFDILDL